MKWGRVLLALVCCGVFPGMAEEPLKEAVYRMRPPRERDPFTIWRKDKMEARVPRIEDLARDNVLLPPPPRPERLAQASRAVKEAEVHFREGRFVAASGKASDALKLLAYIESDRAQELRQAAHKVIKAAENLKRREEAEDAFTQLGLRLEGIIWRPEEESFAVINGEVVKEGQNLDKGLWLYRIMPRKVLFRFRGFIMPKSIGVGEPAR